MTARTHDLAALTATGAIFITLAGPAITLGTAILALLATLIGGILPDIDQPTAPLWRNLPIGKLFGDAFDKLVGGHRFITHSILGVALFGLLAHWLLKFLHPILGSVNTGYVWWAFMIGLITHLIMDSFTKEGVPWLLPLPFKFGFPPLKKWRITTGKAIETLVVFPALIIFNALFLMNNYQSVLFILHHRIV